MGLSCERINEKFVTIHGVEFFDNPSSCIANFENDHWTNKIISFIQCIATFFTYSLEIISSIFRRSELQVQPYVEDRDLLKKRLVVCIHGINATPYCFRKLIEEMQMQDLSETDIYIPQVLERGNTKLDEAIAPILQKIAKWAATAPENNELVLVGTSNGGRIARALEVELKASADTNRNIKKLRVLSIVSASNGSSLVNLINQLGLSWLLPTDIADEMPTDSERSQKLYREWKAGLLNPAACESDYVYIASPYDGLVPNYDSTLPDVSPKKGLYALVPNHGHFSILDATAKTVAEIILSSNNFSSPSTRIY